MAQFELESASGAPFEKTMTRVVSDFDLYSPDETACAA